MLSKEWQSLQWNGRFALDLRFDIGFILCLQLPAQHSINSLQKIILEVGLSEWWSASGSTSPLSNGLRSLSRKLRHLNAFVYECRGSVYDRMGNFRMLGNFAPQVPLRLNATEEVVFDQIHSDEGNIVTRLIVEI